jgi:hypothetical protein
MNVLGDNLGLVPESVYSFFEKEINLSIARAKTKLGLNIELISSNELELICNIEPHERGYRLDISRQLVTRLALISELFYKTRQPAGHDKAFLTEQNVDVTDHSPAFFSDEQRAEYVARHRAAVSNIPDEYAQLVGSFDVKLKQDGLNWWVDRFEIQRCQFLFDRKLRERFRFAIMFLFFHEFVHAVLDHPKRRAILRNGSPRERERLERTFELEADTGAFFLLFKYSRDRLMRYIKLKKFRNGDIRTLHLISSELICAVEGMVFALSVLDCSRMRESDFRYTSYFSPVARMNFPLSALGSYIEERTTGAGFLRSFVFDLYNESSWWFRTRTVFQDSQDELDIDCASDYGPTVAQAATLSFVADVSNFWWHNTTVLNLRSEILPFNCSFNAEISPRTFEAMAHSLSDKGFIGRALESVSEDALEAEQSFEPVTLSFL